MPLFCPWNEEPNRGQTMDEAANGGQLPRAKVPKLEPTVVLWKA